MAKASPTDAGFAGIEIGGTKLQVAVGRPGDIQARYRYSVAKAAGGEGIRAQLAAELPRLLTAHSVGAIGVGFGGPVDWRTGIIRCSHQIPGWADFPLGDWLRNLTRLPVRIDNDANTAALGEALHGAGCGFDPVFYVTLGSGVGGGLVVGGQIYHGAVPGEAEIGHLRLNREGIIVENRCSGWAVDAKIRALKQTGLGGALGQLLEESSNDGGEARCLAPALAAGDAQARQILEETAADLAFALSHVTHLFHPQVIVIGGGLALVGEPLREAVARHLPHHLMTAFQPGSQIQLAQLREDAVPMGALALATTV